MTTRVKCSASIFDKGTSETNVSWLQEGFLKGIMHESRVSHMARE